MMNSEELGKLYSRRQQDNGSQDGDASQTNDSDSSQPVITKTRKFQDPDDDEPRIFKHPAL
ncbi:hypothetical protein K449DRAFT_434211 [Hypoxylon sp. EC38]|nr:hypothetical protein K449DRAFT_434211 [Hypoxylon sp. EC38]